MKALLFLALVSLVATQTSANIQNPSGLEVTSLNVKPQVLQTQPDINSTDLPDSVTRPNPNAGRPTNRAESETDRIERQTNQRIQNMHALENLKREPTPRASSLRVYESEAEMMNNSSKTITAFAWGYRASPALQYTEEQDFLCAVKLAAGEKKRIKVVSWYPNQKVVTINKSGTVANPEKPTLGDVIINQVQYADGTSWQRPDWDPVVLSRLGASSVSKGKCAQF